MKVQTLQRDTVVPVEIGLKDLYHMVCEVRQDQCKLWSEVNKVKSWKETLNDRFARLRDRVSRYAHRWFGGKKGRSAQGRKRSLANQVLLHRAVLYQLSHRGCTIHNACHRAFVKVTDGYKSERCLYDYAKTHAREVEQIMDKYIRECADQRKSYGKILEELEAKYRPLLQGITVQ